MFIFWTEEKEKNSEWKLAPNASLERSLYEIV